MRNNKNIAVIFANVVLYSITVLFIMAISYTCYKSVSSHIPFNLKLIVLLTVGLLFSIVALYMRDNWKINIALFSLTVIVAAYSAESILFFRSGTKFSTGKKDTRSKIEVLEGLRAEGVDAWPHVFAELFKKSNGLLSDKNRIFPLGGISQKTIVYCNESGQYSIYESDEHGFNNPKGLYSKGATKVAIVGDSFVNGACVMPGEDIAGRLRTMGINALNLGNDGNAPLIELALLKEYVGPIHPDIVLWVYYEGNDLFELEIERNTPILMHYLEDNYSQNLLERQDEIDEALIKYVNSQWINELQRHQMYARFIDPSLHEQKLETSENRLKILKLGYLRGRLRLLSNRTQKPGRITNYKSQLSLFSEIMAKAHQRTSDRGGKFYFVYLPDIERYASDNLNGSFFDRDDVLDIVKKLGIPLIDFDEVLSKHPEPFSLTPFLGAHYNAQGYKLVSEFIVSKLKKDRGF
jgi:hypothetical protein